MKTEFKPEVMKRAAEISDKNVEWHIDKGGVYKLQPVMSNEMVQDQLTLLPDGRFINVSGTDTRLSSIIDPEIMIPLQFTGLTDRNGHEIYEGDIVKFLDGQDCSTESGFDYSEYTNKGIIEWNQQEAMFDITNKGMIDRETFFEEIASCEVIGTIYETPELLDND